MGLIDNINSAAGFVRTRRRGGVEIGRRRLLLLRQRDPVLVWLVFGRTTRRPCTTTTLGYNYRRRRRDSRTIRDRPGRCFRG